ncbi:probable RNA-directed DNA polymerase from transposon X-element [Trichonephila clavipes]|nr:probable RNA-directed DNA polymerase from transposon X-element [Trichonephila clavipes]
MNTQDNTLWHYQKYFRKKRSDIPSLNNTAITDEQKAELLAETFQSNFTDNIRPANYNSNIDALVTNTLENFFTNPPSTPITPTDPIEIINYAKKLKNNKSPANLAHTDVFTINALSSDHNPVIFDFITNNILPPILRTLKSTNWIKFQEILYHNIPGNPQIDNLDTAVQNFTDVITNAISASTSTRVINTPHLRLPENIRELIRAKNRFRKLWNNTRYQPYKREVNALIRQIRKEIEAHKNRTWKDLLLTLNPQDNSLYKKITKRATVIPPLHGPGGMAYSNFEKAEAFKDTLEVTFQENVEPYCDDKIKVENVVCNYFDNFTTLTPPLTSPIEVRDIIKRLQNRKTAGPDHIPNIALKYLTLNAITHLTKIYNQCLIKNHFPTQWKQANVVMLPKPNQDHKFSQNYRLISLLSTTAKFSKEES